MLTQTETRRGIVRGVVEKIDGEEFHDEDTEELAAFIALYIVNGWWALSGGDFREFENLIIEHRDRAIASICSMVSMAHAIRSDQADEWIAETTGAG